MTDVHVADASQKRPRRDHAGAVTRPARLFDYPLRIFLTQELGTQLEQVAAREGMRKSEVVRRVLRNALNGGANVG